MTKVLKILATLFLIHAAASSAWADSWTTTTPMHAARESHTATLLPNGKVLVAGGYSANNGGEELSSCELYDPATGTWTPTGSVKTNFRHTATLLLNGKVLAAGTENNGYPPVAVAELYDPVSGTWTPTGSMKTVRPGHTATLLTNGMVLVVGGHEYDSFGRAITNAELYNPATGTWTPAGNLNIPRFYHTATLLTNGQVLVAAGYNDLYGGVLDSSELYDPIRGTWTLMTNSLNAARAEHTATLLPNGQVLVAGGNGLPFSVGVPTSAELYDPASGSWTPTGSMNLARDDHTATLLTNGQVLVVGGGSNAITELYNPASGSWTTNGSMNAYIWVFHTTTLLANGRVLVAGGNDGLDIVASAEVYGPLIAPPLQVGLSGNSVMVWWQNVSGWTLQQTTNLANPISWSASSGVTAVNGTNYLNATLPAGACFYRLIGQ